MLAPVRAQGGGDGGGEVQLEGAFIDRDAVASADRALARVLGR
jgi:hypothetical protein